MIIRPARWNGHPSPSPAAYHFWMSAVGGLGAARTARGRESISGRLRGFETLRKGTA